VAGSVAESSSSCLEHPLPRLFAEGWIAVPLLNATARHFSQELGSELLLLGTGDSHLRSLLALKSDNGQLFVRRAVLSKHFGCLAYGTLTARFTDAS
jgi:hypothetical protein